MSNHTDVHDGSRHESRVPGPYSPELDIGEASLQAGPTFSLISVGVANTGNQNLSPSYTMVVRDEASVQVLQDDGQIDNFYAGAETAIRGRLEGFLAPGAYSVDLTLTDNRLDEPVVATGLPLVVAEPPSDAGDNPEIVNQESNPLWIAGALGLLILLALLLFFVRRRRHRGPAEPPAPVMPPPSGPSWFPTDSMRSTTVAEVLPVVGAELRGVNGSTTAELHKLARLFPGEVGALSAATRQEEIPAVLQTQSSAVLVTPELFSHLVAAYPADRLPTLIAVPEPLLTAQRVAQALR